jgi:RNA polymerase sigma-70 factor (ECF subfamily)
MSPLQSPSEHSEQRPQVPERTGRCSEGVIDQKIRQFQADVDGELAFQQIFECYYRRVRGYFARRLGNAEQVQDLTQVAFLGIYRGLRSFEHRSKFDSYLFQILRNTFLKHLDALRRRSAEESWNGEKNEEIPETVQPFGTQPLLSVEDRALYQERRRVLWQAIAELPDRKRQCVILHYGRGLSYKEIALVLKVQSGTVAATLSQARDRLQQEVLQHFEEPVFSP